MDEKNYRRENFSTPLDPLPNGHPGQALGEQRGISNSIQATDPIQLK